LGFEFLGVVTLVSWECFEKVSLGDLSKLVWRDFEDFLKTKKFAEKRFFRQKNAGFFNLKKKYNLDVFVQNLITVDSQHKACLK
jgi:hypothetical protein